MIQILNWEKSRIFKESIPFQSSNIFLWDKWSSAMWWVFVGLVVSIYAFFQNQPAPISPRDWLNTSRSLKTSIPPFSFFSFFCDMNKECTMHSGCSPSKVALKKARSVWKSKYYQMHDLLIRFQTVLTITTIQEHYVQKYVSQN